MNESQLRQALAGGLFISAMFGRTDGAFVAQNGTGASMVQIGALIADAEDRSHPADILLPESEDAIVPILAREVDAVREGLVDIPIALNAAVGDLGSGLKTARAFGRAGGDLFELNVHGGYPKLLRRGLLRALALPENQPRLLEWVRGFLQLDVPLIVKFWAGLEGVDFSRLLDDLAALGSIFAIHFNVRNEERREPALDFVHKVRPHVDGLLLCSGYVTRRAQVDALFDAGADCIGISQGVLDEPGIIARLTAERAARG